MICAWQAYWNLLPITLREEVSKVGDRLQETRMRLGAPVELILENKSVYLKTIARKQDLDFTINCVSRYSPWSSHSIQQGYITGQGGHRVGICGQVQDNGLGFHTITSLCIRAAKDFPGIAQNAANIPGSILVIGPPGCGKTTFLRDLIRQRSQSETIAVVDEKGEIFPYISGDACFEKGLHTDVITGCTKAYGIESVLRNMGPNTIAVDEITSPEDCQSLELAGWCGVHLLATAHASSVIDLQRRSVYRPLKESKIFSHCVILNHNRTWNIERIGI